MKDISDKRVNISLDNPSITFDKNKCDECSICKNICKFNVGVYGFSKDDYSCINCGSCTLACPNKCLSEKDETDKLEEYLHSNKVIVMQTAPAVRVSLGEEFGMKLGTNVEGKMITALRTIGADYVFDTTFGADLTVMEEASELVNRIKTSKNLPMFTSCCPSWVKFCEMFYPEYLGNLSTCKSPISMMGSVINNYFCKINNLKREDIISIAITPCTSKKAEILKYNDIDLVITARELTKYLKKESIAVYPDTTVWLKDFNYAYNEPLYDGYFWHSAYKNYPVVGVTWDQARAYCNFKSKLKSDYNESLKKKKQKAMAFRLPTEAEWEYAARGGKENATYPWGGPYLQDDRGCYLANFKPKRGNYIEDEKKGTYTYTAPVKKVPKNGFGLYDMAGNVAEWTESPYNNSTYQFASTLNPYLSVRRFLND